MPRGLGFVVVTLVTGCVVAAGASQAQAAFMVTMQHESTIPANWVVGGTVDNTAEAELLMLNGGAPEGTANASVIHFGPTSQGFTAFPGGMNNHMAMRAEGLIDVTGSSMSGVVLTVTSDDGFRLMINGNVVAEHAPIRNTGSTSTAPLTLNDGDLLSLLYFNGPGEGNVSLNVGSSTGALVGCSASGINVAAVPEPASAATLAVLAGATALRRGHRRR